MDGLNKGWESGPDASEYLGAFGLHDSEDAIRFVSIDFGMEHPPAQYDRSGMGYGDALLAGGSTFSAS